MFESPAAALALLLGIVAIFLNLAVGFDLLKFVATVVIVIFSIYQIHCVDVGDCEILAFVYCAIPIALIVYFSYEYFKGPKKKKKEKKKETKQVNK